jgi:hypothetical protein
MCTARGAGPVCQRLDQLHLVGGLRLSVLPETLHQLTLLEAVGEVDARRCQQLLDFASPQCVECVVVRHHLFTPLCSCDAGARCITDDRARRDTLGYGSWIWFVTIVRGERQRTHLPGKMVVRTYEQECAFVKQVDASSYSIAQGSHLPARPPECCASAPAPANRRAPAPVDSKALAAERLPRAHTAYRTGTGFVDNMNVPGHFYVNQEIKSLLFDELKQFSRQVRREWLRAARVRGARSRRRPARSRATTCVPARDVPSLCSCIFGRGPQGGGAGNVGGFLPAMKQIANVAALPGIVGRSIALPDVHAGYGFAIGNVAAFDMGNPESVVSPGGVGFDINCGVRLVSVTNSRSLLSLGYF